MTPQPPDASSVIFEASIVPYRSLGRTGAVSLVATLSAAVLLIAVRVWLLGAWPVMLFSVVEIPLLSLLLWLNMRARRINEMILVTDRDVTVTRTDWTGRQSTFRMQAAWLRVEQQTEAGMSRIMLRTGGVVREVGGFLHEADRESLFHALREALHRVHFPVFDNPQLRDPC